MAYIVDYAITENSAGGATSVTANVPDHQANDYLIMFGSVNGTGVPSVTGWTQIGTTQTANSGITSAVWYFKATTSTTTVTVSISAADDYTIKVVSVRDADLTTFLDSGTVISTNTGTTATSEFTSPTMVTGQANSLVICYHAFDGVAPMAHSDAGAMFLVSSDSANATPSAQNSAGSAIAWTVKATAGTTPALPWSLNISTQRTNHVFAIRNASGGAVPAYMDSTGTLSSLATRVHSGLHIGTLNNTVVSTTMTSTAAINGKTMGTSTATLGADFGINPYSNAIGNTSATVAAANLNGYNIALTSGRNWSTGLIVGSLIGATPKIARYGIGSVKQGGVVMRFGSSATNWCAYQIAAKDALQTLETRSVFAIEPGYTGTSYGTPGSAVTTSAVTFVQMYYNAPLFASIVYLTDLYQVFTTIAVGGTSTAPVDLEGLTVIGNSYRLPLIRKTGSAILSYTPIQIGGGAAVYFNVDTGTIQFPNRYNAASGDISYHANDNKLGLSLAGKSGDTIKLTNSVVTSPISYYFEINSTATSAATWDLSGTQIVKAAVTLRPVTTFTAMTFAAFTAFTTNASVLADCTLTGGVVITHDGGTFGNCTITKTASTTAAYSITLAAANPTAAGSELTTALSKLSTSTFASNTVGPALRIVYTGSAGAITADMSNVKFSGNTVDIRYEGTTGSNLTLNTTSGANPATSSTTNSNTVFFNQSNTFTITNIRPDSEVRVFRDSDQVELCGVEAIGTSSPSNCTVADDTENSTAGAPKKKLIYTHSNSSLLVYVVAIKDNYQHYTQPYTLVNSTKELLISQIIDRVFANP